MAERTRDTERAPEVMAHIAELLAHGYDDASEDHNWMMAQSIYDLLVADRYHTVSVNGRLIALDKLAECDEALRVAEEAYGRLYDQNERVRERVAAGPYCYACGRVSTYASSEDRARLRDEGVDGCVPSTCPAWNVTAYFEHSEREWVSTEDLDEIPDRSEQ